MTARLTAAVVLLLLAAPLARAVAQSPEKVPRIGVLGPRTAADGARYTDAFRQGLRELGWIEGKNIVIEYRWADGRAERLPDLAAELVRLKVDVIFAGATSVALAVRSATDSIPVVMATGGDPVELQLEPRAPGRERYGVGLQCRLGNVGQTARAAQGPKVRRVAVLYNPTNPAQTLARKEVTSRARSLGLQFQLLEAREAAANPANRFFAQHMDAAARRLGVRLAILDVHGPDDLEAAFGRITADAAFMLLDPMFFANRRRLAELAIRRRLPLMTAERRFAEAGFFMTYGAGFAEVLRLAAVFVDKIFRGAKPADLPVEQPSQLELVVNLATAKALGLSIPQAILLQAGQVID